MSTAISIDQIRTLTVKERIDLIDAIWDSIVEDEPLPVLTDAQKAELQRRIEAHRRNPGESLEWAEVVKRIRERE